MLKEFTPYYKSLTTKRAEMLSLMDRMTEQQRQTKPSPKELSPIQVLAHVVKVEETVVGPGTRPAPSSKVGLKGRVFAGVLVNMMRPGFRIPTTPELHPPQPESYEDLKRNWEVARLELLMRIESVTEANKATPITNHMMAGPLSAAMALDFLDVHLRYHWKNFPR